MNNLSRNAGGEMKDLGRVTGRCHVVDYSIVQSDGPPSLDHMAYLIPPHCCLPVLRLHGILTASIAPWRDGQEVECDLELMIVDAEHANEALYVYIAELEDKNQKMRHALKCMGAQGV
jgi:hypothetical protein